MILLPNDSWEIKTTRNKGQGIFTKKDIAPGIVIGDYIGKVIKTAHEDTSQKDGLYLLYYHDYASIYPVELKAPGIHLLNHSCEPNCFLYIYKGHTLFFTLRKIFAGEELTVSYQLSPDDFCNPCPHVCKCGSEFCTKTMHLSKARFKKWHTFIEAKAKKTKRARIRYGKVLPKLASYPENIPDHPIYDLFGSPKKPSIILTINNSILPPIHDIRKIIRETGKTIQIPQMHTTIQGIQNNTIITTITA